MQRICSIYRSSKVEDMYLFVDKAEDLARVPPELLQRFGRPELAMTLLITPQRRLARSSAAEVLEKIAGQGFYLQMPPRPEQDAAATRILNEKAF